MIMTGILYIIPYVCVCVYLCVFIYMCIYIYGYVCVYICVCMSGYKCVWIHSINMCMCISMYVYVAPFSLLSVEPWTITTSTVALYFLFQIAEEKMLSFWESPSFKFMGNLAGRSIFSLFQRLKHIPPFSHFFHTGPLP